MDESQNYYADSEKPGQKQTNKQKNLPPKPSAYFMTPFA